MTEDHKPRFDPTINLGHVLSFCGFILAGLAAFYATRGDIETIKIRLETMENATGKLTNTVERLAEIVTTDARQDERISSIDRRVDANERRIDRMVSSAPAGGPAK